MKHSYFIRISLTFLPSSFSREKLIWLCRLIGGLRCFLILFRYLRRISLISLRFMCRSRFRLSRCWMGRKLTWPLIREKSHSLLRRKVRLMLNPLRTKRMQSRPLRLMKMLISSRLLTVLLEITISMGLRLLILGILGILGILSSRLTNPEVSPIKKLSISSKIMKGLAHLLWLRMSLGRGLSTP